ncbi:MAG: 2-oxo acid dehydrogenase subunit E2 [Saprospiraceae bacterium]|nr:2-oxo acid dehydrogenase subunit E2 [Saprospiraceae bacterium]
MAEVKLIMPKMGESIMEATILNWVKKVGDSIEIDETVLEIATDKVDSEVPSPVAGVLSKILFEVDAVVPVGAEIAIISTEGEEVSATPSPAVQENVGNGSSSKVSTPQPVAVEAAVATAAPAERIQSRSNGRFYSPLVKNIARQENIGQAELDTIPGTGKDGRVTKRDILGYIDVRSKGGGVPTSTQKQSVSTAVSVSGETEIVEMDRMRRLIADHMVNSKKTSPHVTSFVEVDVTGMVDWRNRVKNAFQKKYGEKITYTPILVEAVSKAIRDFPMVNISVDGKNIIVKKDINVGMATALPSGNLIVPVIKSADQLSLIGLTKKVNDLAFRARNNELKPDEIQGGTFTLTNVGTFGNVMGTPIINQPQVAILAAGAIRKKPAVIETDKGDFIGVRQMMFLSLSYDHRVVDGFLGGSFLRKIGDYLEQFDDQQGI